MIFDTRKDRDSIELLWIKLLVLAADVNDDGHIYITEGIPHTMETLAAVLARPAKEVTTALNLFLQYEMLEEENGVLTVTNWRKYQNVEKMDDIREYNRQAQRKSRAKRKCVNDMSMTVNDIVNHREDKKEDKILRLDQKEKGEWDVTPDGEPAPLLPDEDKMNILNGIGRGLVMISDNQMGQLVEDLSTAEIDHYIGVVADQLAKGKTYRKSHYQAIMDMVMQDRTVGGR